MSPERQEDLKSLTQQAVTAAEAGRWDQVINLYQRRAQEFPLHEVSPDLARQLIGWDRMIQERAQVIQNMTRQHLLDIKERRRKLQQLRQRWIQPSSPSPNLSHAI